MKKKYAMKWIKALRSGKYKQGFAGEMKDQNGGYCCLGVLREVCKLGGLDRDLLSNSEIEKVGMRTNDADIDGFSLSLANLNDDGLIIETKIKDISGKRFTFEEIADIIEIEWPNL